MTVRPKLADPAPVSMLMVLCSGAPLLCIAAIGHLSRPHSQPQPCSGAALLQHLFCVLVVAVVNTPEHSEQDRITITMWLKLKGPLPCTANPAKPHGKLHGVLCGVVMSMRWSRNRALVRWRRM